MPNLASIAAARIIGISMIPEFKKGSTTSTTLDVPHAAFWRTMSQTLGSRAKQRCNDVAKAAPHRSKRGHFGVQAPSGADRSSRQPCQLGMVRRHPSLSLVEIAKMRHLGRCGFGRCGEKTCSYLLNLERMQLIVNGF
jgi:hypothetical protein